eukprot:jgi/Hompol1/3514/HPOL_002540-RA
MEKQTSVGLQARAYVDRGHLVPDAIVTSLVLSRLAEPDVAERGFLLEGLRYDPVTGRTYHLKYDPPPRNAVIETRLIKRSTDTDPATRARLAIYHRNISSVLSCFKSNTRRFKYPEGIAGHQDKVFSQLYEFLGTKGITKAPRCHKIVIAGLPGSGKTRIAEAIERKYGYVHGLFLLY